MKLEDAKVLVVDDDALMRKFVTRLLERLGIRQLREAGDGHSALLELESFRPDVLLSDIHMRPLDGIALVRQLRAHGIAEMRKTPVLLMSAQAHTSTPHALIPLGIAGFIDKPPNLDILRSKIEHAIRFRP